MDLHALLKGVISNYLEWFSDIFNDTKHRACRAVSLRQLSFLLETCFMYGRKSVQLRKFVACMMEGITFEGLTRNVKKVMRDFPVCV